MSESSTDNQERCSFCGKSRSQVKKLIQGPAANICNECVDLCIDIMEMDVETENENNKKIESLEELPKPKELHEFLNDYMVRMKQKKLYQLLYITIIKELAPIQTAEMLIFRKAIF